MSDDERRTLRELETQLDQQSRLVKLSRQLSAASVYTALRRLAILSGTGGAVGLALLIAGIVAHHTVLLAAGIGVLAGTQLVVGVAAIVLDVRTWRREHRP